MNNEKSSGPNTDPCTTFDATGWILAIATQYNFNVHPNGLKPSIITMKVQEFG
jgi:hypothetical protein